MMSVIDEKNCQKKTSMCHSEAERLRTVKSSCDNLVLLRTSDHQTSGLKLRWRSSRSENEVSDSLRFSSMPVSLFAKPVLRFKYSPWNQKQGPRTSLSSAFFILLPTLLQNFTSRGKWQILAASSLSFPQAWVMRARFVPLANKEPHVFPFLS